MSAPSEPITALLVRWREGDSAAGEKVVVSVYEELRGLAARYMRSERADHTLQPTALVHEMFLRLCEAEPVKWQDRAHFFAVAARQLRRILVNHARDRQADKRGGKRMKVEVREWDGVSTPRYEDLLELDQALNNLEATDARASRVIELRFFAGLKEDEIAEALGVSLATVKRDWTFGRAWLLAQLRS
jgi:RNA polymerase sigma factor (TIGR02999 family)